MRFPTIFGASAKIRDHVSDSLPPIATSFATALSILCYRLHIWFSCIHHKGILLTIKELGPGTNPSTALLLVCHFLRGLRCLTYFSTPLGYTSRSEHSGIRTHEKTVLETAPIDHSRHMLIINANILILLLKTKFLKFF